MADGRVFLLESPNALDLLEGTGETTSLSQVCKLFGHDIASFLIRDERELKQTLMYVGSLGWPENRGDVPIFIHISAHGSDNGLAIGSEDVPWNSLATAIVKAFEMIYSQHRHYPGPIILVVSACGTDGKALCTHLRETHRKDDLEWPPEYVFVFEDEEIDWRDAVVTWTIFYREAPGIDFLDADQKDAVQKLLKRVDRSGYGSLRYFRWVRASGEYKTFPALNHSN